MDENKAFLTSQIITYLGNKRNLLPYIETEIKEIQKKLNKEKTINADLFSGSGIVSRLLKKYSSTLIVNDLEDYAYIINQCYLANYSDFNQKKYAQYKEELIKNIDEKGLIKGIISKNYAPLDDENIQSGERVFYTTRNANYIDSIRSEIDKIDLEYKKYFLAPLLYEASVKTNTAGVFKGFYKDMKTGIGKYGGTGEYALNRIKADINLVEPVFSNFECNVKIYKEDTNILVSKLEKCDIVYLDPPYNQHPYGSNYFMLNVITNNKIADKVSNVSGIPNDWNRSSYNKERHALKNLEELLENIKTNFLILSYNSEGIVAYDDLVEILKKFGKLKITKIPYNTYRGSRNLSARNLYVDELLFTLDMR